MVRRRKAGAGMAPLFDLAPLAAPAPPRGYSARGTVVLAPPPPRPGEYWVRGVFRIGDGRHTLTVRAVGMRDRLDDDAARFVAYLRDEGFQFAEGRGYLTDLLGVGAEDDGVILLAPSVPDRP